jgi:hypothetical protein
MMLMGWLRGRTGTTGGFRMPSFLRQSLEASKFGFHESAWLNALTASPRRFASRKTSPRLW